MRARLARDAARLLNALDRGYRSIEAAADRLERELTAAWAETFTAALWRDLIDAGDFRPVNSRSSLP